MAEDQGRTALYRLFGQDGSLLYVGITGNPERRFREHSAGKHWWHTVVTRTVEWYDSRRNAEAAEQAAIKVYEPAYNSEHCRYGPVFTVTASFVRPFGAGMDILCAMAHMSRERFIQDLVERELRARGLFGDTPCYHSELGWPDGVTIPEGAGQEPDDCPCRPAAPRPSRQVIVE